MKTLYKIRELLLPGNWNEEAAKELLEDAVEELSSPPPEPEIIYEPEEPAPPTIEDYERLKSRGLFLEIGDVRVVWESLHGEDGPVRATIWIDGETWLEHVNILQPGGQK